MSISHRLKIVINCKGIYR
uniref:Uncharacterized protein n=1 Tax=Anguilla anguilla TaxID=7936 RepID=A0A0E9PW36_ANGAN